MLSANEIIAEKNNGGPRDRQWHPYRDEPTRTTVVFISRLSTPPSIIFTVSIGSIDPYEVKGVYTRPLFLPE